MNYAGQCLFPASSQHKGGCHMVQITITLDNTTAAFYQHVSGLAGLPLEACTVLVCDFANWADTAPLPCLVLKK